MNVIGHNDQMHKNPQTCWKVVYASFSNGFGREDGL